MVELVDTLGLEPSAARRGGSTPSIPTILTYREKPYIIGFMSFSFHAKLMRNHRNRVSWHETSCETTKVKKHEQKV